MIICQDCGTAVASGNQFCTRCGHPLDESGADAPPEASSHQTEASVTPRAALLSAPPRPAWSAAYNVAGQPVRRRGLNRVLSNVAIAAVALLLAVKALAGFILGLGIVKLLGVALFISMLAGVPALVVLVCVVALALVVLAWHTLLG